MLPFVDIGPLHVSTFYVVYVVAIVVGGTIAIRRLQVLSVPWHWPIEATAVAVASGMLGAVAFWGLLRVVARLLSGASDWFAAPGSTAFGAIAFGLLAALSYFRWRRMPLGRAFDLGIPAAPLGQAIGRLGCLLAGCCYGKPTTSWLGMVLPGEGGAWCRRHPTQLYSALVDLAIFGLLLVVERRMARTGGARRGWFPGCLTLLWGCLYFSKRFAMEFVRAERPLVWGPLTWAHLVSALGLLLVAGFWLANRRWPAPHARAAQNSPDAPPPPTVPPPGTKPS